jgi:hypothetical protein
MGKLKIIGERRREDTCDKSVCKLSRVSFRGGGGGGGGGGLQKVSQSHINIKLQ